MGMHRDGRLSTSQLWLKCPRCARYLFFYRARSDDYMCRACGAFFKVDFKTEKVSMIVPLGWDELVSPYSLSEMTKKKKSKKR